MTRRTKKDRAILLCEYVVQCAYSLGLTHWEISFDPQAKVDEDNDAEIGSLSGNRAVFAVSEGFWRYEPEKQRRIITHELCHLHVGLIASHCEALKEALAPDTYRLFAAGLIEAEENVVESFARVLAPCLPLPPKFK